MASLEHLPAAYTCMAQDGPRLGSLEANAETAFGVQSVYEMSTSVKERSGGRCGTTRHLDWDEMVSWQLLLVPAFPGKSIQVWQLCIHHSK